MNISINIGRKPELFLRNHDNVLIEKIDISKLKLVDLHALMSDKGVTKKATYVMEKNDTISSL
jgi:hypothetical protein